MTLTQAIAERVAQRELPQSMPSTPTISFVYPTRDRPAFIRYALWLLEHQIGPCPEIVVCDNPSVQALSCETICADSPVPVVYIRPERSLGMVANWNHAMAGATGDYVAFLTDKMFVLPDAVGYIRSAIRAANYPDVVSWVSDAFYPSGADYFDEGEYWPKESEHRTFSPAADLNRRGRAEEPRWAQDSSDYARGKIVFGAYRRDLIERIVARYGCLFHGINPDYTSMILAMTEAKTAIELATSCVVSLNVDLSNGMLTDRDDSLMLAFLSTLDGGLDAILPRLMVPGLYASQHNCVASDFLNLKRDFGLDFKFNADNWLAWCHDDIYRPERAWSSPRVEAQQKGLIA